MGAGQKSKTTTVNLQRLMDGELHREIGGFGCISRVNGVGYVVMTELCHDNGCLLFNGSQYKRKNPKSIAECVKLTQRKSE
jgi:hypothetical protein